MPRIVRLYQFGGPENLKVEDAPSQQPGSGEVRLRVEAAGVNRDQFTFMSGQHYSGHGIVQPKLPTRLGYEVAGVVEAVGEGVDRSWIGKRVSTVPGFDQNRYGALGEEAVVPVGAIAEYPSNLTTAQAAFFWIPYLTAYGALVSIAPIQPDDYVSIPAGGSSVGLAAIEFVRDAGATAIAVTRTSAKKQELLSLGAHHVIVTGEEDYQSRINEITNGKGVQVTFDPLGGPFLEQLAAASAPGGIIIEYGRLSGQPTPFPVVAVLGKGLTLRGYTVSEILRNPQAAAAAKQYIFDRVADGRFVPKVATTFPLERTVDAYKYVESNQQMGRVVITVP
ncbi:MAG: zinc-dependent alcohol dehydrogenase family protein [Acidobacteriota bacterium]|nr:zinc-dependent alcohol dehydrogenase family protein [Acidobacteriota bacterium]